MRRPILMLVSVALLSVPAVPAASQSTQVPPSIRGSRPATTSGVAETPMTDTDRRARCGELKGLIDVLTPEIGNSRLRRAEVADYRKMRNALNCPGGGVLAGTWQIEGVPKFAHLAPMKGSLTLQTVDQTIGRKLAQEPNWGNGSSRSCMGGTFFYAGTIVWDKGSFFDKSMVYWTDKPSTIVLCTEGPDSTQAKGNFRDGHEAHGGFIQWNGPSGGYILPERNEGPDQTFTATRK